MSFPVVIHHNPDRDTSRKVLSFSSASKGGKLAIAADAKAIQQFHIAAVQFQPSNDKPANVSSTGEADLGLLPFAFDAKTRHVKVVI